MRVLVVQLGCIGDLIIVSSAIEMIQDKFPSAVIDFIVGRRNYSILKNNPNVNRCLIFDKNPFKLLFLIAKLRKINYDYYIDPKDHFSNESKILSKIARAKVKIGFNLMEIPKQVRDDVINVRDDVINVRNDVINYINIPSAEDNKHLHLIERVKNTINMIDGIDISNNKYLPKIYLSTESKTIVDSYLSANSIVNYILINISASRVERMWSKEKWVSFINTIKEKTNKKIILVSDKIHSETARTIASETTIFYFPPTTLQIISALISLSDLLISPDTSLVHIASAFDIDVLSLTTNAPANQTKFAPLSTNHQVITAVSPHISVPFIEVEQVVKGYEILTK